MVKQNPCGLKIWNQIEKALYFYMQPDQNSYEIVKWVKNEVYIQEKLKKNDTRPNLFVDHFKTALVFEMYDSSSES